MLPTSATTLNDLISFAFNILLYLHIQLLDLLKLDEGTIRSILKRLVMALLVTAEARRMFATCVLR